MSGNKEACALLCSIMSAVAVPFLIFLGYLCMQGSHMIELPNAAKTDAAWGCFGSALLYAITFAAAFIYKIKAGKEPAARQMEEKIFLARVAEQAERFDDMVDFLKEAIDLKSGEDFTIDERNLLSVGFKNLIGSQRGAIRTIGAIEQNPKYQKFGDALAVYKKKIEQELYDKCMLIVETVQGKCIKLAAEDESKAFFQKMIGDYYRYVAESATEDKLQSVKTGALQGYEEADKLSKGLNPCNPIRLGLALNFSVFHYEVMNDHKKACELGEKALSEALEKIDDVDEETFRDAKSIIELLKENLSLWKEEDGENAVEDL